MELKLQQAIVATRAGRTDVAQSLLAQLIRENPDDANAWFLLGHIVDTPERQALYLQRTVELEPDHAIARQRLLQLENGPIPAPILPQQPDSTSVPAAANGDGDRRRRETGPNTTADSEAPNSVLDLEDTQLETPLVDEQEWPESASRPVRERRDVPAQTVAVVSAQDATTGEASDGASGEVWLVRILVIMVIVAAIVLGILVLLIML